MWYPWKKISWNMPYPTTMTPNNFKTTLQVGLSVVSWACRTIYDYYVTSDSLASYWLSQSNSSFHILSLRFDLVFSYQNNHGISKMTIQGVKEENDKDGIHIISHITGQMIHTIYHGCLDQIVLSIFFPLVLICSHHIRTIIVYLKWLYKK